MPTCLKNWLEKADNFMHRNRGYLRPVGFLLFLVVAGIAVEFLFLTIVSIYALTTLIGAQNLQLMIGAISAISAIASASAAFLIYRGNVQTRRSMIQPRIFVYGSKRQDREHPNLFLTVSPPDISIPGIFLENIGKGPAVKGTLYVMEEDKNRLPIRKPNEKYTFIRITDGERYHLPSVSSPELVPFVRGKKRIRVRIEYFDINDEPYSLPKEEGEIDLYPE